MHSLVKLSMIAGASASPLITRSSCWFGLTASGGPSGTLGQLPDGQIRIGGGLAPASFSIYEGKVTDDTGFGCLLTDSIEQFQCDQAKAPAPGFSIGSDGLFSYSDDTKFYACPASDSEWNVYTTPVEGQKKCVEIILTASGCGAAPLSSVDSSPSVAPSVIISTVTVHDCAPTQPGGPIYYPPGETHPPSPPVTYPPGPPGESYPPSPPATYPPGPPGETHPPSPPETYPPGLPEESDPPSPPATYPPRPTFFPWTNTTVAPPTLYPTAPSTYANSSDETTTTVITKTSVTNCPVTSTYTTSGTTSYWTGTSTSTTYITETSTICPRCTGGYPSKSLNSTESLPTYIPTQSPSTTSNGTYPIFSPSTHVPSYTPSSYIPTQRPSTTPNGTYPTSSLSRAVPSYMPSSYILSSRSSSSIPTHSPSSYITSSSSSSSIPTYSDTTSWDYPVETSTYPASSSSIPVESYTQTITSWGYPVDTPIYSASSSSTPVEIYHETSTPWGYPVETPTTLQTVTYPTATSTPVGYPTTPLPNSY